MTAPTNPYLRTKVMTASPAELRLMLLDGALRFLDQGIAGLEAKDYEQSYNGISRCQHIVMELINSLSPDVDPDLCSKLSGLYTFMYTRLVTACTERDASIAQEVRKLLSYERETWVLAMDKLGEDDDPAAHETPPEAVQGDEVGTRVSLEG